MADPVMDQAAPVDLHAVIRDEAVDRGVGDGRGQQGGIGRVVIPALEGEGGAKQLREPGVEAQLGGEIDHLADVFIAVRALHANPTVSIGRLLAQHSFKRHAVALRHAFAVPAGAREDAPGLAEEAVHRDEHAAVVAACDEARAAAHFDADGVVHRGVRHRRGLGQRGVPADPERVNVRRVLALHDPRDRAGIHAPDQPREFLRREKAHRGGVGNTDLPDRLVHDGLPIIVLLK